MAAGKTITEQTWARDLDGAYKRTDVSSSFENIEPASECIQYTKNLKDHTYTINEQFIESGGEGTWQIDCTVSQEPIEVHSYFSDMSEVQKRNWALWKKDPYHPQLTPAGWEPSTGGSEDPSDNEKLNTLYYWWQRDVTHYLAPRVVAKWTAVENHPPDCSGVGKIAEGWVLPVGVPNVNFLLSGANGRQLGTPDGQTWYQNTYEFLGSAPSQTGWQPFLYARNPFQV
jgi:hypothetical protein